MLELVQLVDQRTPLALRQLERRVDSASGDELIVSMWIDGGTCLFQTKNQDGDVVIDQGIMKFS